MTRTVGVSLVLLLALAACSSTPAPVPVAGKTGDLQQLAGEWEGEYSSEATGRSGTIVFKLAPGEDHAHGDVLMIPRGGAEPFRRMDSSWPEAAHVPGQLLVIRFVVGRIIVALVKRYPGQRISENCVNCVARAAWTIGHNGRPV